MAKMNMIVDNVGTALQPSNVIERVMSKIRIERSTMQYVPVLGNVEILGSGNRWDKHVS